VTFRKYLVLAGVTVFAAVGDPMLSYGMKQTGAVSLHHLSSLLLALLNPWVAFGIVLLLAFFASYMNALSWADLTYVLPATSISYVFLALIARFALHEQVSLKRWLGIALITGGVGFIAGSPSLTSQAHDGEGSRAQTSDSAAGESFAGATRGRSELTSVSSGVEP
jgi:drug/metabolite transporter (DMT)-like permease